MLFDRYWLNNYARLITYYPVWYRDVFEMVEILKTEGRLLDDLDAGTLLVLD
jgi:hypothetical protein